MAVIPIHTMVMAAFFDSGGRKAWTPLLIASIPVKAVQPAAKARRMSQIKTKLETAAIGSGTPDAWTSGGAPKTSV